MGHYKATLQEVDAGFYSLPETYSHCCERSTPVHFRPFEDPVAVNDARIGVVEVGERDVR